MKRLGIWATAWGCQLKTLGEDTAAASSTILVHTVNGILSHMPAIVVSEANTLRCKASLDSAGGAAFLSFKMSI